MKQKKRQKKMFSIRKFAATEYAETHASFWVKAGVDVFALVVEIVLMFLIVWNVFQAILTPGGWVSTVNGDSMYPTLHDGQILFSEIC